MGYTTLIMHTDLILKGQPYASFHSFSTHRCMSLPKFPLQWFQSKRRSLPLSSLQFRLTLGIIISLIGGLGGTARWMSWKAEQMLLADYREQLATVTEQLTADLQLPPHDGAIALEPGSIVHVQAVMDQIASADTWLWIRQAGAPALGDAEKSVVVRSLNLSASPNYQMLMKLTALSEQPQILTVNGQHLIWCTHPLTSQGKVWGQLYVAQDVTRDYQMLTDLNSNLMLTAGMAIALLSVVVAWIIWRSLHPLRQANQLAESYASGNLNSPRLDPSRMPTEVQELAHTCNQLVERLSTAAEQQRTFTSNVSHELRTPLSLVYGYLQSTLKRGPNLTEAQQTALSIAASETERTIELLQSLLELARTTNSAVLFTLQPVALNDVVADLVRMTEQFKQRSLQIHAPTPLVAIADRDHLLRVLVHLVDNAIHYSDVNQPITLTIRHQAPWALLQVSDRGSGISEAEQAQVFESFHRTDPSRSRATGGVGLGLAIVKSLVEGMGGQVSVQSRIGEGSTFTVKLPLATRATSQR